MRIAMIMNRTIITPRHDGAILRAAFTVSLDAVGGSRCMACEQHVAAGGYHECWAAPTHDRSGEAGETPKSGSTEGESGLPEGSSK